MKRRGTAVAVLAWLAGSSLCGWLALPSTAVAEVSAGQATDGASYVVASSVTETQRVVRNGDGTSTLEISAVPVRVKRSGKWVPVDTRLVKSPSGELVPAAASSGLSLSRGGDGPLLSVIKDGVTVAWTWPTPLPEPDVRGDTAVYAEVLPGVDLHVQATPTGFGEALVVKSAAAAADPRLERLSMRSQVTNGAMSRRPDGGLDVHDVSGRPVLAGAAPMMWDDAGPATGSKFDSPREGDRTSLVTATPTPNEIILVPDLAVLRGPNTVYPVAIDPDLNGGTMAQAGRTMLAKNYPTTSYWNWTGSTGAGFETKSEGVGYYDGIVKRLLWQFNTAPVAGKNVVSAQFSARQVWAFSCTPSQVNLSVTQPISSFTTWANQPADISSAGSKTISYGREQCTAGANVNPSDTNVEFDVTAAAQSGAAAGRSAMTLKLQAASESSNVSWKRFEQQATLSIRFNSPPDSPQDLRISSPGWYCATGFYAPVLNPGPGLQVNVTSKGSDPDGNDVGVEHAVADAGSPPAPSSPTAASSGAAPSGSQFTSTLSQLASQRTYSVRARTSDVPPSGSGIPPSTSAWTEPCEFTVDTRTPAKPTLSPAEQWNQGGSGMLRISGSPDTVYFDWTDGSGRHGSVPAVGGRATLMYGPLPWTAVTLSVSARGRTSESETVTVTKSPTNVARPALQGVWRFEELKGPSASPSRWDVGRWGPADPPLIVIPVRIGVVAGNDAPAPDQGLQLHARPGFVTNTQVVDPVKPFSLALKVQRSTQEGVLVSQTGSTGPDAFRLEATTVNGNRQYRWTVQTSQGPVSAVADAEPATDGPQAAWDWVVVSTVPATSTQAGHVDAFVKTLPGTSGYASGHHDLAPGALPTPSPSGTQLRLGASFTGVVDDLNIWAGPVDPDFPDVAFATQ